MIWRNPAAWFGLAALAVPILVHFLGRRRPKPLRFPTLRFLDVSRIVPARRHRLNDVPLLVVRMAMVTAAVAALAGPAFVASPNGATAAIARAIVVDASPSMARTTARGRPARDEAREQAQALVASATTARVMEGVAIPPEVAAAVTWLGEQPGQREIVVLSDFQTGALDRADLAGVPADVGMSFVRIDAVAPADVPGPAVAMAGRAYVSRLFLGEDHTRTTWILAPGAWPVGSPPSTFGAAQEQGDVEAALEAAAAEGAPASAIDRPIAVVFPRASERAMIAASARPASASWMFDVIKSLHDDAMLASLRCDGVRCLDRTMFASEDVAGSERLVLLPETDASHVFSAALLRSAWRAAARPTSIRELEPAHIPDATLARWGRPATASAAPTGTTRDDIGARWLWALVLVLLGVETWMRRPRREAATEVEHARVA